MDKWEQEAVARGEEIYLKVAEEGFVIESSTDAEEAAQYCLAANAMEVEDGMIRVSFSGDGLGMVRNLILDSISNSSKKNAAPTPGATDE